MVEDIKARRTNRAGCSTSFGKLFSNHLGPIRAVLIACGVRHQFGFDCCSLVSV